MIGKNDVWLITGCSKGLGRALARQALDAGYRVVLSARRVTDVEEMAEKYGSAAFAVQLDVTRAEQAADAIAAAQERFGRVDVLVNNAGYGYLGAIEEGDEADVRALFDTLIFGPWYMARAALPGMRARKHGHIVNISSVGGMVTFPSIGFYHMAKFALEGFSETLSKEVASFGLGVTVVEPGAFRTDFRGGSLKQSNIRLPAYAETAGKVRESVAGGHGKQAGDPVLGALAIIKALESDRPPLHLVLGKDALEQIRQKLTNLQSELDAWQHLSRSTDFRDGSTG